MSELSMRVSALRSALAAEEASIPITGTQALRLSVDVLLAHRALLRIMQRI